VFELYQKVNGPRPKYLFAKDAVGMLHECRVVSPDRKGCTYRASGNDNISAKQKASELAFAEMHPLYA
jgi:hypothetical protein